jgi:hypothetical protein
MGKEHANGEQIRRRQKALGVADLPRYRPMPASAFDNAPELFSP